MKETISCYIEIVSPIHIGCDETYEPTGFVVDEPSAQLTAFDPLEFIRNLTPEDKKQLSAICLKGTIGSLLEIYKFFSTKKAEGKKVHLSAGFLAHYKKTLSMSTHNERQIKQELNNFTISRTAFLPGDDRPYIPGSSLKGSIRTAYMNKRAKEKSMDTPKGRWASRELETALLDGGRMDTDPFRLLKVSDFMPVGNVRSRIVYAVNEKKRQTDQQARGPYQILECIEPGAVFRGRISLEQPDKKAGIQNPLNRKSVFENTKEFYTKEREREKKELEAIGCKADISGSGDGKTARLIRIGRHSGAESVTIEGHRNIRIMGRTPSFKDHATTFWLASEESKPKEKDHLKPFGWAVLRFADDKQEQDFEKKEKIWRLEFEQEKEAKLKAEKEAQIKAKEEAERIRLEAERREQEQMEAEEAERKRQEELANMTEEQRAADQINRNEFNENQVVEIFNKLDEYEDKTTVAQALKAYWQQVGKWKKKNCSKKQFEKVQKIKEILGEL